jgi:nitrate/nitrite transporter NarK
MNSSVGGVTGVVGVVGGCGGGVVPHPTWTLALSESVPPSHVTVAVLVRPVFGDAVPLLHVHRSSYVFVHESFVRSPSPRDWSI